MSLNALADLLDGFVSRVGRLAMWLFLPLIAIILFDVVTRKIPGFSYVVLQGWLDGWISSTRLQELEWHLHTALFALVLGWAYLRNAQVRVDLLRERTGTNTKLWIELVGSVVMLIPFSVLMLWYGMDFVASSYRQGEGSAAMTGLSQRWIIKGIFVFGAAMVFVAGIAVLLRIVAAFRTQRRARFDEMVFPRAPRAPESR